MFALREVAAQVDPARLAGLSISAQRETFVPVGKDNLPLENAFLWMDERCRDLLPEIERIYGRERFHQETGKPLSANLSIGKLYWLRAHRPDLFSQIERVYDVHAFLAERLTGRFVTSWGCADPMGLFDMRENRWNRSLIELLGMQAAQFPEAVPSGTLVGAVNAAAAQETGLPEGLPIVAGIGDGQAAGLGVNAVGAEEVYLNLGTAVVTGTLSRRYLVNPAFRTMYSGLPGAYSLETVLLGGAYTISWFVEKFTGEELTRLHPGQSAEEALEAAAQEVPPGALGLTLVPYWNSAMNPYWDPAAAGIVIGWRGVHGQAHTYRAILEGIAFELRLHLEGVETALGVPLKTLTAVGGGARSSLWRQIIADVTGRTVSCVEEPEASALGAGIIAAAGAGLFAGPQEAAQAMAHAPHQRLAPDPQRSLFYTQLYEKVYRQLYPALRGALSDLADLTEHNPANSGINNA